MDVTTSGSKFENCTFGSGVNIKTGEDKMFESPVRIEIVHMVNGRSVDGMSKEELMNCLMDIERYNKKLEFIQRKAKSKSIEKEMKKNEKVYKKIVKYLDR